MRSLSRLPLRHQHYNHNCHCFCHHHCHCHCHRLPSLSPLLPPPSPSPSPPQRPHRDREHHHQGHYGRDHDCNHNHNHDCNHHRSCNLKKSARRYLLYLPISYALAKRVEYTKDTFASASSEICAPGGSYFGYSVFPGVMLASLMHSPESLFQTCNSFY